MSQSKSLALALFAGLIGAEPVLRPSMDQSEVGGARAIVVASAGASEAAAPNANWQAEALSRLEQQEYVASQQQDGLQAPNRAQNLRTYFREGGIDVVPRESDEEAATWQFAWRTSGWGRVGQLAKVTETNAVPRADGARVTYAHNGLDEWYENKKEGLEQGFTVHERPAGDGPLVVSGRIEGGLCPTLSAAEGAIDLLDEHGARALRYGELHVWDARGEQCASHLAVDELEVAIVIEDDGADYPLTIDPMLTSPSWTAESNQASALMGFSVSTAGDVNGDGFSDVIVGAWGYDNGQTDEGRAFVYHGSSSGLSLTANWTAESDQASALFGYAVATAGDVNGDGFDDVIVGASRYDNGATDEGRAFVYHGSAGGLSLTPNWTAESNQAGAEFGSKVATAGDVNGDGSADVIVGCPLFDNGQSNEGRAFVYHGSASGLSLSSNWTGEGDLAGVQFGAAVSAAGDVNGDGFADVIVGSWTYSNGQANEGRALVYHGSASGLSVTSNWSTESNQANAFWGTSVGGAGDVNGDGFADVIIGAPGYSNGQSAEGGAFVYHGSASGLDTTLAWTAESNLHDTAYGQSVGTAGDVNGDGYADVIVGAHNWSNGQFTEGRADVFHGSAAGLTISPTWTAESNQASANFGISVSTAGDVNGDGYSDVIVGAWTYDNGQTDEGSAFVYHGSAGNLATTPAWTAESNQVGAYFGASVASAGDVNGDGYSDVIVGAFDYDNGEDREGRAFVYHGSPAGLSLTPDWTAESDHFFGSFGISVSTAGDVNGDGYSDVIVGANTYDDGPAFEGWAFVYHGSATGLATTPSWTGEGNQQTAYYGYRVSTAGDVNGDGFGDVIVGAIFYDNGESDEGRAFVYHGSAAGLGTSPAWTAESDQPTSNFCQSVATAGDVNGDGYSDVIVGASAYDNGQLDEGRVFVYHGSAAGLSLTPDWTAESDQVGADLGECVGTAGDVNGDGFSDVIVSAPFYDNGQADEGRVFVYQGSAAGLALSPIWSAEGNQAGARFGTWVATAGDVSGDGYSDVIIGAPWFDNIEVDEGRAFVYRGSASGLSPAPIWTAEVDQNAADFGVSVATAGDVNGDGFSDVIVGSDSSNGQAAEGAAFLYYGNAGDGLDRIARQARTDDTAPISLLGSSDSESAFLLKVLGRTPAGRARVRLQYEVKPFGTPFDGSGLVTGNPLDTGTPAVGIGSAVALSDAASSLSAETPYRWRLRILTDSPLFPRSPWLAHPGNAATEADLRTAPTITGVAEVSPGASGRWLRPGAPNPFTTATRLSYALPARGRVRLAIYDVSGRKVTTLADEVHDAGAYALTWDGHAAGGGRVPSGVYFARLEFGGRVEARKIVLVK